MWPMAEEFVDKVKVWWASYMFGIVTFNKWQLWSKLNALDRGETHTLTADEKLE